MARALANDPLGKFKYRISIPGLPNGMGFTKASGLKKELATVEYNEGGFDYTRKLVGREKVEPVTLERGMFAGTEFEELYKKALHDPNFRTQMTIELLDRLGVPKRKWTLAEAWCKTWEGSDLDASSDDVAIEKITIEFEYFL